MVATSGVDVIVNCSKPLVVEQSQKLLRICGLPKIWFSYVVVCNYYRQASIVRSRCKWLQEVALRLRELPGHASWLHGGSPTLGPRPTQSALA